VVDVRDASASVIDGQSNVGPETEEHRAQRGAVGDGFVLGDLQDHRTAPRCERPPEHGGIGGQRRRDIETEPSPGRQEAAAPKRYLEGHGLELDAESAVEGGREGLVGPRSIVEPGQRLEADRPARRQLDDGRKTGRRARPAIAASIRRRVAMTLDGWLSMAVPTTRS
jgi:hypothetical protein